MAINKQVNGRGGLFQRNFRRVTVRSMPRLLRLVAYIHRNPIHHKFRNRYDDWYFSSCNMYLSTNPTKLIREEVLSWFDAEDRNEAIAAFLEYHQLFKIKLEEARENVRSE